ncbi:DUF6427 family protein [Catalinimonas niigatensis]|uniref:DUF6427 family protein n=1 Tax=Catalinimonas niigatensis TaxID=1397264 RepID=UPI002666DF5B|nr:DUF6427 family protein [Catalinimonas niigatensis]WPP53515.1 DUF6427 family protein [Catalinimonas niigatensis]
MNDPYRMLGIFVLLVLIRLPFLISDVPLILPELNWMLVGEKLSEGSRLYIGVWDNIGPLAALIYSLIELIFNRSQTVYVLLAIVLTTYQALVFNTFLINKKAFNETTYVPAFLYVILSSFSFDFYVLSPVLLSLTWILLALRNVFYRVESRSQDDRILSTGIYIGLAILCYLPSIIFLFSTIIAYMLFASVSFRRYLLLLYGTSLPILITLTYFFLVDGVDAFLYQYLLSFKYLSREFFIQPLPLLYLSVVPLGFLVLALYKVSQMRRFTNQQTKLQQIMFIKIIATAVTLFFVNGLAPYHLLPFVPPAAFFITHYLLSIRRFIFSELTTALLVILVILNGYAFLHGFFSLHRIFNTAELQAQQTPYDEQVRGKKILVLGDQLSIYHEAYVSTPYLDWQLAQSALSSVDYFENLTQIYNNFSKDMPEVIIDLESIMPQLQSRIPLLEVSYQKQPGSNEIYTLIPKD